jgi:rRNA-processing protein FCF1
MKITPALFTLIERDSKQLLSALLQKHILIDTNFLIDANRNKQIFSELIESFKNNGCPLVTINGVYHEFIKGRKSLNDYKLIFDYYQKIIDYEIPFDSSIKENANTLIKVLLKRSSQISYTDILLLATLMKYNKNMYLLSKDRSDIPLFIFPIKATIPLDTGETNCFYSLYSFNQTNYEKELERLLKKISPL